MQRQAREHGQQGREGGHSRADLTSRRRAVEERSAPILLTVRRAPRWLVPLVPVALLLAGLAAPPAVGGPSLLLLVLVLGWLAYLSWPQLGAGARGLRVLALVALLALGTGRLFGVF